MFKYFIGLGVLFMVAACSLPIQTTVKVPPDVKDFLGDQMISVIAAPERVESFRVNAEQEKASSEALAGFPISKQGPNLNEEQLKKIQSLIFDENSYHFGIEKSCKFRPEVGLKFIKGGEAVVILLSFSCDLWLFAQGDDEKIEDSDPVREELIELAYSLFPLAK
ncbi:hypothetical protein [Desulfonema magnum]|uniref:DUF4136 domain-containing protein n=1 Tax=Desulfonema magnum TaxID=45655 RepID=A0A975BIW5_9BACT|nr:hypothetical protein [Desulfonema magnum]QTA86524.1 Uncharacterized protein dnm_025480 [Desulfonema magnum]